MYLNTERELFLMTALIFSILFQNWKMEKKKLFCLLGNKKPYFVRPGVELHWDVDGAPQHHEVTSGAAGGQNHH